MSFNDFLQQLKVRRNVIEACFYFADEPEKVRWVGYIPDIDEPYWAGGCDIPDGTEFKTAEELVTAKIYYGRSLADRWDDVRIDSPFCIGLEV